MSHVLAVAGGEEEVRRHRARHTRLACFFPARSSLRAAWSVCS
jgi:hypothetical protein